MEQLINEVKAKAPPIKGTEEWRLIFRKTEYRADSKTTVEDNDLCHGSTMIAVTRFVGGSNL